MLKQLEKEYAALRERIKSDNKKARALKGTIELIKAGDINIVPDSPSQNKASKPRKPRKAPKGAPEKKETQKPLKTKGKDNGEFTLPIKGTVLKAKLVDSDNGDWVNVHPLKVKEIIVGDLLQAWNEEGNQYRLDDYTVFEVVRVPSEDKLFVKPYAASL